MNRRPPHEYEEDDIMLDEQDYQDSINDSNNISQEEDLSPIGRLMDDDVGFENEPSAYVSGFSRKPAPEPEKTEAPRRRRERPETIAMPRTDPSQEKNPRRRQTPVQELSPGSGSEPGPGDDFYEAGIREARRRRPQNPDPRPAVRAAVPTSRRMAQPPPRRHSEPTQDDRKADQQPEDSYDTFRQRYRGDLISSGASRGTGGERTAARRQPPPQGGARNGHAPARTRDSNNNDDAASLLRMGLLGGIFLVFVVFIILIVRINTLANRNSEAEYTIASMEDAYERYHSVVAANAAQDMEIRRQEAEINRLNSELAAFRAENMPGGADGGGQAIGDGTPGTTQPSTEPPPEWPRTHTIVTGDSLGRIARAFYGSSDLVYIEHIAQYNNIRDPNNIPLGRTITIPAPPGTAQ